ncbi:hypothetical protein ACFL04_01525 [Patescibacteria group bacterium]
MKRKTYIIISTIGGFLLSFIVHSVVETLLLNSGISWTFWHPTYHLPFGIIIALGGIAFGWWVGTIWWDIVYVQKKHHGWFKK